MVVACRVAPSASNKEDSRLHDIIMGEILDTKPSVRWDDVAGLGGAKQVITCLPCMLRTFSSSPLLPCSLPPVSVVLADSFLLLCVLFLVMLPLFPSSLPCSPTECCLGCRSRSLTLPASLCAVP